MSNIGLPMGPPQRQSSSSTSAPSAKQPPKPKRRRGRAVIALVVVVGVIAALAFAAVTVLDRFRSPEVADFSGEGQGTATVVIAQGATLTDIGAELQNQGVVASTQAFVNAAAADPAATGLQPGTYELRQQMSGAAALTLLKDPAARVVNRFTIPEGTRMDRVVQIMSETSGIPAAEFQAVLETPEALNLPWYANGNPEGFLFPATYEIPPDATAESLLVPMVAAFNQVATRLDLENRAAAEGLDPYEVVVMASLVQAEGIPEDFAKVARVIVNRLNDGMPLQFDSTSNYISGTENIQLSVAQKEEDTPYNTYLYSGLVPTPINQPGEAALEAALAPEEGPWLYFVATDPDRKITKFTADYQEHLANVDEMFAKLAEKGLQYQPD